MYDSEMLKGRKSAYNGELAIGGISIPVCVYKAHEQFSIPTSNIHKGCGCSISQPWTCELHPNLVTASKGGNEKDKNLLVAVKAISFGEDSVEITDEERRELLGSKEEMRFVSAHKLSLIPELMGNGNLIPVEAMFIAPQKTKASKSEIVNTGLQSLLERMRVKKVFIVCSVGLGSGTTAYLAILPTGRAYRIAYEEELLSFPETDKVFDKTLTAPLDAVLGVREGWSAPSLENVTERVVAWCLDRLKATEKKSRTRLDRASTTR